MNFIFSLFFKGLNALWRAFFPYTCILCQRKSDQAMDLCCACEKDLPYLRNSCQKCGAPLEIDINICGQCLKKPLPFDRTIALFHYETAAQSMISRLKFREKLIYGRILGELFSKYLQKIDYPDLIIPIPLHKKRLRHRGFNQSLELAKVISKKINIPINYNSCRRIKKTEAQSLLKGKDRYRNIRHAFKVIKPINAKHIAVIDDVMTTGNTLREFCGTLKRAGVEKIDVWCIARARKIII